MSEEEFHESAQSSGARSERPVWAMLGAASRDKADAFIDEQTILTRLQAKEVAHELHLRHWQMRFSNVSSIMKLSFEVAMAFIVMAIAACIGAAVWSAAHDHALVIDAFAVPPDMAEKGLTGQVVATQLQDHLSDLVANTDTIRRADSFRNNWDNDIKVVIPDTGVSIGQLYNYLVGWLGHQTHITGEVWHTASGISLSARAGGGQARKFDGSEADLDKLVANAAQHIYCETQPYRCAVHYLIVHDRAAAFRTLSALALKGPAEEKPWALTIMAEIQQTNGDLRGGLEKARMAAALGPNLPNVAYNLAANEASLGHAEAQLAANRRADMLFRSSAAEQLAPYAVAVQIHYAAAMVADEVGDWHTAIAEIGATYALQDYDNVHETNWGAIADYLARTHDVSASARVQAAGGKDDVAVLRTAFVNIANDFDQAPLPALARAEAQGDWKGARDDILALHRVLAAEAPQLTPALVPWTLPRLAHADAALGDFAEARAVIEKTPLDCYSCVRTRGNIRALEKKWDAAEFWFAEAVRQGPSLPFAYADWGAMLLAKGDTEDAIAKFKIANQKSPHFADPLEMWGEALMQKNRSDLALAKFEEAAKYAPNWGRLHLKWGEALFYAGKKDEARKQFVIAAGLDLSQTEKAALVRGGRR